MPNHVTTRCIITGPTEDIKRFRSSLIQVPEGGAEVTLDFDQIIPMPQVIKNTDNAGDIDLGIELLTGRPRPDMPKSSYLTWPFPYAGATGGFGAEIDYDMIYPSQVEEKILDFDALGPLVGQNERIGGSRAQHDLIEFTLLKAYLDANRLEEARRLLARRRPGAVGIPVTGIEAVH